MSKKNYMFLRKKEMTSLRNLFKFFALTVLFFFVMFNVYGEGNIPDNDLRQKLMAADYKIVNEYGFSLQQGYSTGMFYEFKANHSYRVVVYSNDQEVLDIDLLLTDTSGNVIKKDVHYQKEGILNFDITQDVEYKLVLRNFKSQGGEKNHLCHMIVACKEIK